jgi:hypothetical protein
MMNSLASGLLVSGASLVIGGVTLTYGVRTSLCALRSRRWPRVTGTVLQSEVTEVPTGKRFSKQWRPVIVYSYEVAGIPYRSDQWGLGFYSFLGDGIFQTRSQAEKLAALYRPGNRF